MLHTPFNIKRTALLTAVLLELGISSCQAAIINVDGGGCNLADAITAANTNTATGGCTSGAGVDTLELASGQTFTLNTALPEITADLTINANNTTIERDFLSPAFMVFKVNSAALTLNDATVSGGLSTYGSNDGAGIRVYDGSLNINNSTITRNYGGALIFTRATNSSINNSVIEDNYGQSSTQYSGGVTVSGSNLVINESTISNNSSGGLYLTDFFGSTTVDVNNSTISGNYSTSSGGGIAHNSFGNGTTLNVNNSTISSNVSNGNGGGMAVNGATVVLSNTTFAQNYAQYNGGAINVSSGSVQVQHSLLAGQYLGGSGRQINVSGGTVTLNGSNLFGFNSDAGLAGVSPGASDVVPSEPNLSDVMQVNLTQNGGSTMTHGPNPHGPAIDVIAAMDCLFSRDQIGGGRPVDGDGDGDNRCDVGAVESQFNPDVVFRNGFD